MTYERITGIEASNDDIEKEKTFLKSAIDHHDAHHIVSHTRKLFRMLIYLPSNKAVRKEMRKHYYPNIREWGKTVEATEGAQEHLDAFMTVARNAFQKLGYEI